MSRNWLSKSLQHSNIFRTQFFGTQLEPCTMCKRLRISMVPNSGQLYSWKFKHDIQENTRWIFLSVFSTCLKITSICPFCCGHCRREYILYSMLTVNWRNSVSYILKTNFIYKHVYRSWSFFISSFCILTKTVLNQTPVRLIWPSSQLSFNLGLHSCWAQTAQF